MEKQVFIQLLDKYLTGNASPQEEALLQEYYRRLDNASELSLSAREEEAVRRLMLKNIRSGIRKPAAVLQKSPARKWWYAAASVVLLLAVGSYFLLKPRQAEKPLTAGGTFDVAPGGNKALLTLANGQVIVLDSTGNTRVDSEVMELTDGMLVYKAKSKALAAGKVQYNQLSAPRGGQFHIKLSDGTDVRLNAASSISYPTVFAGKERRVSITGEVYFEVAKDAVHPFVVSTRHSEITVLGTHFDVMAYEEEPSVKTTLLEGSVKVTLPGTAASVTIAPGQQASIANDDKNIVVQKVDTNAAIAWTQGYLFLQKSSVQEFMNRLSSWYDVDIEYSGQVPKGTFGGMINRNTNLSDVLSALAASGIHTKLEAKKIIVLPN